MWPWAWLLVSVSLTAGTVWLIEEYLFRRRSRFLIQEREALAQGIADAVLRLASLQQQTASRLEQLAEQLGDGTIRAPVDGPWLGAFLPTDAAAAELERVIQQSEDHAISASGPIRFSSGPSRPSAGRSARAPLIRPGRTSGAP